MGCPKSNAVAGIIRIPQNKPLLLAVMFFVILSLLATKVFASPNGNAMFSAEEISSIMSRISPLLPKGGDITGGGPVESHQDPSHNFWERSKEGWFWYEEDPPEDEVKKEEPKDTHTPMVSEERRPSEISREYLNTLSASELRVLGEQAMELAVSVPTLENVYRYQFIQKFMTDRSEVFARAWTVNLLLHPELVGRERISLSEASRPIYHNDLIAQSKSTIKTLSETAALLYFYEPSCSYCQKMQPILNSFEREHGWYIKRINITEENDLALSFGVESVPDMWVVYKNPDNSPFYYRVRSGFLSKAELESSILFVYQNVIVNPEINKEGPGILASENANGIASGVPNMPREFVRQ